MGPPSEKSSNCTSSTSTSTARIRLAEKKSKLEADRRHVIRLRDIERRENDLRMEREDSKIKREADECRLLEEQLNELDQGESNSIKSLKDTVERIKNFYAPLQNITRTVSNSAAELKDRDKIYSHRRESASVRAAESDTDTSPPSEPLPYREAIVKAIQTQNEISLSLKKQQELSHVMPRREFEKFDGVDITKFKGFWKRFETSIEARCSNDADRLSFLEQYTSGEARKIVQSCCSNDPELAYQTAKNYLLREYDNEFKVASAFLEILDQWPTIKSDDADAMRNLTVFLNRCKMHLENLSLSNQLNSPKEILNIVSKLPYRLRDKWRYFTLDTMKTYRVVLFRDLVDFLEMELEVVEQPLWGDLSGQLLRKTAPFSKTKKLLATQTVTHECQFCGKQNHHISKCFEFEGRSLGSRFEILKKLKLCFACLSEGHQSRQCEQKLMRLKCSEQHPTVMHKEQSRSFYADHPSLEAESQRPDEDRRSTNLSTGTRNRVVCPIVGARVESNREFHMVNVALDTFSSDCWIKESMAKKMNLTMYPTTINLTTMYNTTALMNGSFVRHLKIGDVDGNKWTNIPLLYVRADNEWPFTWGDLPSEEELVSRDYLRDLPFSFLRQEETSVLVGMNMPGLLKPLEVADGKFDEPYATRHWLGWAYNGPTTQPSHKKTTSLKIKSAELEANFQNLYSQDFIDPPYRETFSMEEKLWYERVGTSIRKLENGSYEVELPFYDKEVSFPSNKCQAKARLMSLNGRFKKNPQYYDDYKNFINTMIFKGFAERVPNEEKSVPNGKEWYLVHHAVYHKQKKKIRVVFNCSLCYEGVSLNDKLMQGPDLTNSLVGVLLRFRQDSIAFTSDIEKMFYQVKVPSHQSNYLKFLWFDDEGNIVQYRLTVHVFGAKSSPSVANYALRRAADDYSEDVKIRNSIYKNFYVDDLLKSVESITEAITVAKDIKSTVSRANFNLTSFRSNCSQVLFDMEGDLLTKSVGLASDYEKTLGLEWDTRSDMLKFGTLLKCETNTRRGILSTVASIYDPLGLLSPVVLRAKRIFQETCRLKLEWDDPLPTQLLESWNKWKISVDDMADYAVSRCLKRPNTSNTSVELHLFCDGSELAYGAVAYLKFGSGDNVGISTPVYVKSRLTPINNTTLKTVPRIELCSAKLAVEIAEMLQSELEYSIEEVAYWTDSTIVLSYLKNESKRFHRFVDNKVSYIRSKSSPHQWQHVATESNPADIVSRGATLAELARSSLWREGPSFLKQSRIPEKERYIILDTDAEIKRESKILAAVSCESTISQLLNSSSSFYRLKRKVVWIIKFSNYVRKQRVGSQVTIMDLKNAETFIFRYVQQWLTGTYLKNLKKLAPIRDSDGILRVGGRLKHSSLSYSSKHPVILPGKSSVAEVLSRESHVAVGHLGKASTAAHLRERVWIIGGSRVIRRVLDNCMVCKRYQSKPNNQIMSDLPASRMEEGSVFKNVGLDYFGPFHVVHGRRSEKRYGVIFTCLSTRAAHLEVAHSLTTDSFINALRRFISRRGDVQSITSDNGTNLVGAERELREAVVAWNTEATESWLKKKNITWKFNPPTASHYGGIWEREIRTVRKVLHGLMREQPIKLNDDCLHTLFCEIESILNNRPITPVSDDPGDCEALTPNHALLMNTSSALPPAISYVNNYRKHWRRVQYLSSLFWTRWRKEYLSLLQQRQKWFKEDRKYNIGDLVLVTDLNLPRNQWPLGRLTELKCSEDGRIRTVSVKIMRAGTDGTLRTVILLRPVAKLIHLLSPDEVLKPANQRI